MEQILNILFALIPFLVIGLIIYIIIRILSHKNKGEINYGNSSLNILDNQTTDEVEDDNVENKENKQE